MNPVRKILRKSGIDIHRIYPELNKFQWMSELPINSIFDIGGHKGESVALFRKHFPDAFIYSFEPIKECADMIPRDDMVSVFNLAVSDYDGQELLNVYKKTETSSFLRMSGEKIYTRINVRTKTLDQMYKKIRPKGNLLVKVDVQGSEGRVFFGGRETFDCAKIVIIESCYNELYEYQLLFPEIYNKMREKGYSYKGALHQSFDKKDGHLVFEDSIFTKK